MARMKQSTTTKLPCIHLYPGDWLRDGVSGCSLAAQGLWLRMMFIAHDAPRYGYLEAGGICLDFASIARRCGCEMTEFNALFSELKNAGVPSVTEAGCIYSRRMVRDASTRELRVKAGRKGGKQTASKRQAKAAAKPKQNTEDEVEDEYDLETDFESFWKAFPKGRKKSKGKAREAFRKAAAKCAPSDLISAAIEYADSAEGNGQYVKMPESWLNGECWSDDRAAWAGSTTHDPRGNLALRQRMLAQTQGNHHAE